MNFDKEDYSIKEICEMFDVDRSTFFHYKKRGWIGNGEKKEGSVSVWYRTDQVITLYKKLKELGKIKKD